MPNYQQSKIYKIINDDMPGMEFYGSTCNVLSSRLYQHKKKGESCKSHILFKGRPQIFLVENYTCHSKNELYARERWWIENNDCINRVRV
tara:strand:+ start:1088 stop:1357 length:270 start_codon:yes stop_codon:yes gene_type:complete